MLQTHLAYVALYANRHFKKKNVPNHDMALRRLADMLTLAGIVSGLVGGNARVHSRDFTVPHALHFW